MEEIENLTKEDLGFFHICLSCLHIQSPQWSEYIDRQYNDGDIDWEFINCEQCNKCNLRKVTC